MELLYRIAEIRTPFLDVVMNILTHLGDEMVLLVTVLILVWCVNKTWGFRLLYLGLMGNGLNQLLKGIFLLPRPWVQDPQFQIVESAREAATGYSFPSGHTQSGASLCGGFSLWLRRRWWTVFFLLLSLLIGFTRLYLGVHTPLDVTVGLLVGWAVTIGLGLAAERAESRRGLGIALAAVGFILMLGLLCYLSFGPKTAANHPEFDAHGIKNAWTLLGTYIGLLLCGYLDKRYVNFPTKAVWWAQILKCAIGFGLVVGIRAILKTPLRTLFGGSYIADAVRYFLMTVAGGFLWPLTFRFFGRLGNRAE